MKVVNYSEFRNNLSQSLNAVNDDREIVIVSRTKGKNVVVMDLDEYNSIQETLHLTSTKANRKRLEEAITEMNNDKFVRNKLIEKK
ncbi:MAG: type II toxin-antitoxin system prevent-host-death family antitoxin [Flavobacterium psychrophilum]|nr:MAG: type II toxin-antitoxin system prevent-host-death family antitoxin [Flavobacterium psychrophilum]